MSQAAAQTYQSTPRVRVQHLPLEFVNDDRRVITLPFLPGGGSSGRVQDLLLRIAALTDEQVEHELAETEKVYAHRHRRIHDTFEEHYHVGITLSGWHNDWSESRRLLAGAYMTMEYAIESAALFNPSMVPHPDQTGLPEGAVRFIMSLRATGEGHVSSIVFRSGVIGANHTICIDPPPTVLSRSRLAPDRRYHKPLFERKLKEIGVSNAATRIVLDALDEQFSLTQLNEAVQNTHDQYADQPNVEQTINTMIWLARSNYRVQLPPESDITEYVMYPMSDDERQGIEDLRLVPFVNDDGSTDFYGTYTAYNGHRILPMMMHTRDFQHLEMHSLNGACATNKGMALFPRKIGGHYVMCSRIDGQNLFISYSDYEYFWEEAERLAAPHRPWELVQLGNCGSPIETPEGWLLLTHGVGPLRTYHIGAMLLDLEDPTKIIGSLAEPLISPAGEDRKGYVPNVVYTCGAMAHRGQLYLPFAVADKTTTIAVIDLADLIDVLIDSPAP